MVCALSPPCAARRIGWLGMTMSGAAEGGRKGCQNQSRFATFAGFAGSVAAACWAGDGLAAVTLAPDELNAEGHA